MKLSSISPEDAGAATYAGWCLRQVGDLSESPAATVRNWRAGWRNAFQALVREGAIFEVSSLVIARWEFLGSLHVGLSSPDSGREHAEAYAHEFLAQLNPRYSQAHPTLVRGRSIAGLLIDMFRDRSLHGFTPAAYRDGDQCIVWAAGSTPHHLRFTVAGDIVGAGPTALNVDGATLVEEFSFSMERFAEYLEGTGAVDARRRFRTAFWWRLHPKGLDPNAWAQLLPAGG